MFSRLQKFLFTKWAAQVHDLLWIVVAIVLAYWVRFNLSSIPDGYYSSMLQMIVVALFVHSVVFWAGGLYRGVWRYASIPDLFRIIRAVGIGSLFVICIIALGTRLEYGPRSVFLLYPLFLFMGLASPRLLYRWYKDHKLNLRSKDGKRTLIIGAGKSGELLLRDLLYHEEYQPLAFVDDDQRLQGREIHGIKVIGDLQEVDRFIKRLNVELVVIAIPSITGELVKKITAKCVTLGVDCRLLPALEVLSNNHIAEQLRPVSVDDLLGRDPVCLDEKAIADYVTGKTVLVTGGGGSIGSELCRQVAEMVPDKLIIFDHGEFNLYSIDHELRESFPDLPMITVLGDVKNFDRVEWVFKKFKPSVVFHAAAYKHVPMLEINPAEGVLNNVHGTKIVADAAHQYQTEYFVFVSTDKAVNPANVMGTTKRIAELYCQNLAYKSQTKFITTRFGNVLGSAGSVVPLFEKQIQTGGPVTVTHQEITRYFMTIPEAVSLILQAGAMGKGGEIFVLDMGEPMLIRDLAEQMIRLSGKEPYRDVEIKFTGLRPGEKLYEEVLHANEALQGTSHAKLLLAKSRKVDWQWLEDEITALYEAVQTRELPKLMNHLVRLVPEYSGRVTAKPQEKSDHQVEG